MLVLLLLHLLVSFTFPLNYFLHYFFGGESMFIGALITSVHLIVWSGPSLQGADPFAAYRTLHLISESSSRNLITQINTITVNAMPIKLASRKLTTVSISAPWICVWVRQPLAHCRTLVSSRICAKSPVHQHRESVRMQRQTHEQLAM
jgi:hypothetical protein